MQTDYAPPRDWALDAVRGLVATGEDVVTIDPSGRGVLAAGLRAAGHRVATTSEFDLTAANGNANVVVLDEALAWVPDEIATLRSVAAQLAPSSRLIVTVGNITWFPARLQILQGTSPFGSGDVVQRPMRFFARSTLLHALAAAGLAVEKVVAVSITAPDVPTALEAAIVERVRAGVDADIAGFVAVARR